MFLYLTVQFVLVLCLFVSVIPAVAKESASGSTAQSNKKAQAQDLSQRLPNSVRPTKYTLSFEPDIDKATFDGSETIFLTIEKSTKRIILNSKDIVVSNASIASSGTGGKKDKPQGEWTEATIKSEPETERVLLDFPRNITPGNHELQIKFKGTLNNDLCGFYRCSFKDKAGKTHWMASTQMEPTDARRMFPCFDEPAFKASYKITVAIDPSLVAISNAPVKFENMDRRRNKKMVTFAETPIMSTYLVALIIGPLESTPVSEVAGIPVRVWTTTGRSHLARYGKEVAVKLLPYFIKYFGTPYPGAKLDLIAIPDFSAGAMENLGAITFRETALLVDNNASTRAKQGVTSVIAHEMAHMWFGDLVTMQWWDELWLNEAFATWMADKAVDFLHPEWNTWDDFALSRADSMDSDSLRASRAIHFEVNSPSDAHEMFDEITYSKGGSILRMLEQHVGEAVFQKGIQAYMRKHAFSNASTEDLWNAIAQESHKPISRMMNGWVDQVGCPLITTEFSRDGNQLILEQKRYLLDKLKKGEKPTRWYVPYSARFCIDTPSPFAAIGSFEGESTKITGLSHPLPFFLNSEGNGYFRTKYSDAALTALSKVARKKLTPAEKISLLSDQASLAVAGFIDFGRYLDLLATFENEKDPSVASLVAGQMYDINSLIDRDTATRKDFSSFVRRMFAATKNELGWAPRESDSDLVRLLRSKVLQVMGTVGEDKQTIDEARQIFDQYVEKRLGSGATESVNIDGNILSPAIQIVAYNGGKAEYEKLDKCWRRAATPEEMERALMSLTAFRGAQQVDDVLKLSMSTEVRTQDAPKLLAGVFHNVDGRDKAWDFTRNNWKEINERLPFHMVPWIVSAASSLCTSEREKELKTFFADHPVKSGRRAVLKTLEIVKISVSVREHSYSEISGWFTSFAKSNAQR